MMMSLRSAMLSKRSERPQAPWLRCWVASGVLTIVVLIVWMSVGVERDHFDAVQPASCSVVPCAVPLFVAVLNDASAIIPLWQSVVLHNEVVSRELAARTCGERAGLCYIYLHILDNVDCDTVTLIADAPQVGVATSPADEGTRPYFDAGEHLLDDRDATSSNEAFGSKPKPHRARWAASARAACRQWAAIKASLLGFDHAVMTQGMTSMNFGQSMNWFMRTARRVYHQPFFLWAHTDVFVDDYRVLGELLSVAQQLRCRHEPFSYVLMAYDALCVVHADAIADRVGMFDTFMWYYGEVDLMLRAELSGLPMLQLPTNAVRHVSMSSLRRGSATRFERMMRLRLAAWRGYYQARWSSEFHIDGISTLNVTYAYVQLLDPGRCSVPSLRRFVDGLGVHLHAPHRLTIRGATFAANDASSPPCPWTSTIHSGICGTGATRGYESFVFYFLPVAEFDAWVDHLVARWESGAAAHHPPLLSSLSNETLLEFTKSFGIRRIEFFSQGFDKK